MRKTMLEKAKYVVSVVSEKATRNITIKAVFDKKAGKYLTHEEIVSRGLRDYVYGDVRNKDGYICRTALDGLKEDLNWMLNGNSSKYQFSWGQSGKTTTDGTAYVFD